MRKVWYKNFSGVLSGIAANQHYHLRVLFSIGKRGEKSSLDPTLVSLLLIQEHLGVYLFHYFM